MNYTRRRALLACDFCRHRKRRCDGERPCSTCREANADCVYQDLPVDRIEGQSPAQGAVVERLGRIEALLEEQGRRLNDMALGRALQHGPGNPFAPHPQGAAGPSTPAPGLRPLEGGGEVSLEHAQFLIPYNHGTAAVTLLSLPLVRSLVGDFRRSYFYDLEAGSPLPAPLDLLRPAPTPWPDLDPGAVGVLTSAYFRVAHPHHPLFSREHFASLQAGLLGGGPSETPETVICLCAWALGALAAEPPPAGREPPGLRYFAPAWRIVLSRTVWGFEPSMATCQALVLAASYLTHLGRPLHSWKMAHFASHEFLRYFHMHRRAGAPAELPDSSLRVFWACFMIECDRVAELDVARTEIEPLADTMPLPRSLDESEADAVIYFVAETAVRRLLNRIHSSLYSPEGAGPPDMAEPSSPAGGPGLRRLLAVSSELDRQLEEWYGSIPGKLRPPAGVGPVGDGRAGVLRARYHAARHIIHRPFVLGVARQRPGGRGVPRVVLERCAACLASCEAYLYSAAGLLGRRSPYLWSLAQGCMACLLVLAVAGSSPRLRPLTPALEPLFAMILPRLGRWAAPGSSFEAVARILGSLRAHLASPPS